MVRTELISKSPLRILEKSLNGGVGKGCTSIIAGPKGTGKTACLVHIATDQLFQGRHVIHISFADDKNHIAAWYEDIFQEVARRNNLDGAMDIHNDIIKNRVIMNFRVEDFDISRIEKSIRLLWDNTNFHAETIIVDGFNFARGNVDAFKEFTRIAQELSCEMWFSAAIAQSPVPPAIPPELKPFAQAAAIIISLEEKGDHIRLDLLKDHDSTTVSELHLSLDPKILLILED